MAVKACTSITLFHNIDIIGTTYYYKLVTSLTTPNVPDDSVVDPTTSAGGSWSTSEPSYTSGSTSYLYYTIQTRFSDGTQSYSYANIVSGNRKACLSSSYEAAKEAYNRALNAENIANAAEKRVYHTCSSSGGTSGYFYFARCVIVANYCNKPISFTITNRGIDQTDVELRFTNNSGTDPAVSILKKNGKANVYIVKADTSTWDLYVQKTESYDSATFTRFNMNGYDNKFTWTWKDQTVTSLPSDYITAVGIGEIIVGTQTAATGSWTGIANFDTLKDGQEITYWLPYAGSGNATLNLTLSGGNTTGAKNVYYGGTTRVTTHYSAGSIIRMVYRENVSISGSSTKYTGWWCDANYDTNNTDRLRFQNNVKMGKQYVWNNRILGGTDDGYFPIHGSVTIDKDRAILWNGNNTAPYGTNNNTYLAYSSWDMRYNAYQYYSSSAWQNGTKFNLLDVQLGSSNKIYSGTGITGNSTTATIFSGSGVSSAVVNDRYINTSTGYYYKCTVAGAASAAKWVYEGNSTIPAGKRLYWGTHLTHTDGSAKATATAISSAGVGDRYINHSTGRLYECTTAGASGTAKWTDKGIIIKNNKTLYLVGVLHGQSITIDDVPFTTEPPTEEDGKIYMALGNTYNIYTSGLFPEHPLFMFKDGSFKSMDQITYDTSIIAKKAKEDAETAKTAITDFLEGEDDGSFTAYKRQVESDISSATGEITNNFSTYIAESDIYQNNIKAAVEMATKIDSYIKMSTNNQGQPYMELGVQPSAALPNTYRLRIENNEIYMVYGSGDTTSLTKLTRWYTSDGKSSFDVNTLVTQQEMAITPFRFIKNDDGSLSFRKVD